MTLILRSRKEELRVCYCFRFKITFTKQVKSILKAVREFMFTTVTCNVFNSFWSIANEDAIKDRSHKIKKQDIEI